MLTAHALATALHAQRTLTGDSNLGRWPALAAKNPVQMLLIFSFRIVAAILARASWLPLPSAVPP